MFEQTRQGSGKTSRKWRKRRTTVVRDLPGHDCTEFSRTVQVRDTKLYNTLFGSRYTKTVNTVLSKSVCVVRGIFSKRNGVFFPFKPMCLATDIVRTETEKVTSVDVNPLQRVVKRKGFVRVIFKILFVTIKYYLFRVKCTTLFRITSRSVLELVSNVDPVLFFE